MRLDVKLVARRDLERIYDFNLERGKPWAEKVERRLDQRISDLLVTPNIGRPVAASSGVKRLSVADIQYVIDYEVAGDSVRILRVRHTREIR